MKTVKAVQAIPIHEETISHKELPLNYNIDALDHLEIEQAKFLMTSSDPVSQSDIAVQPLPWPYANVVKPHIKAMKATKIMNVAKVMSIHEETAEQKKLEVTHSMKENLGEVVIESLKPSLASSEPVSLSNDLITTFALVIH
jgi:hypothetical protein